MKHYFTFKKTNDTLTIIKEDKIPNTESLNNTSVINIKELTFTEDYLKDNIKLIADFFNLIIIKNNITIIKIKNSYNLNLLMELINQLENIKKIVFLTNTTLDNKTIKEIECYTIPKYLLDRLDTNKHLIVHTREREYYDTKFMKENFLSSYSDLYYKKSIIITHEFNEKEYIDFKNLININNKLKRIRFIKFDNNTFSYVMTELVNNNYKNILIIIDEHGNNLDLVYKTVPFIKKSYSKYFKENNITFKVNYSLEYKRENFLKELNVKMMSTIVLGIIIIGIVSFGFNSYKQYLDSKNVNDQMNEISGILDDNSGENTNDEDDTELIGDEEKSPVSNYVSTYYTNFSQVFSDLKAINPETVGWLKINNTKINYPIVQHSDNEYYLNHDFKKYKNIMGWIFMDYRNDDTVLDQNTILYGHNTGNNIMFGGISGMFKKSWYSNAANQIITFNIPGYNMKWKIFSMYKVPATTDYLQNNFFSDEEYQKFIDLIKGRTEIDFGTEVTTKDKILTLSTCYNSKTRHVIHAVLVEVTPTETTTTTEATTTTAPVIPNVETTTEDTTTEATTTEDTTDTETNNETNTTE